MEVWILAQATPKNLYVVITPAELDALPAPQFWRRASCVLYEQLVLLGVIALTFLVPNLGLGILFGFALPSWLTFLYLYAVLGIYFVWYWTKSGQMLAMQTWRVRMIGPGGCNLTRKQAIWRYVYGSPQNPKTPKPLIIVNIMKLGKMLYLAMVICLHQCWIAGAAISGDLQDSQVYPLSYRNPDLSKNIFSHSVLFYSNGDVFATAEGYIQNQQLIYSNDSIADIAIFMRFSSNTGLVMWAKGLDIKQTLTNYKFNDLQITQNQVAWMIFTEGLIQYILRVDQNGQILQIICFGKI